MHTESGGMADRTPLAVAGLREGNPDAWSALYRAHADDVWQSVARLIGSNSSEVADVVQETFLAAAKSIDAYDPDRGTIRLWLCGIARNCAMTHLRAVRRGSRVREGGDLAADVAGRMARWLDGRDPEPPVALATAETAQAVRVILSELPDDYATILVAKYCDDDSVHQIAQAEKSTTGAIRSKLARARRAFREIFTRWSARQTDPAGGRHE